MRRVAASLSLLFLTGIAVPLRAQVALPNQFGDWTKKDCVDKPVAASLFQEAGDTHGASSCQYSAGDKSIQVWVEKFRDPSSAYEVYTSELHHGMMASLIGNNAAVERNQLWMLTGNLVLRVDSQSLASEADLRTLVKSLDGHADKTALPPMRAFLSSDGLIQGTQRYSLGPKGYEAAVRSIELNREAFASLAPELGFGSGAEVMLGAYRSLHQTSDVIQFDVLLLVEFPTPQLAEQQLHHLQPLLASKPEFAGTTVERDASLLSLVLSPSSPEMAARLRKSIKYDTAITWNEPSQTLTDPPWFQVLKTVFFAAAGFCVFAALAGLIFGVFRLLVKRLFPGKVFDRSGSVELLQLGLNSKEIKSDDFY